MPALSSEFKVKSGQISTLCFLVSKMEHNLEFFIAKTNVMQLAKSYSHTYQVRISCVPRVLLETNATTDEAINKVISTIGCKRALAHIYSKRVFEKRNESTSGAEMVAIAVKITFPVARDAVISSTRRLKNVTAGKLFGISGDSGVQDSSWSRV